jgi:hypothetical protein
MVGIAYPVHYAQGWPRKRPVAQMILDDDSYTRDSDGLKEENHRCSRMVEDIDEKSNVDACIFMRKLLSIEVANRDRRMRSHYDIDTGDVEVRARDPKQVREEAVATANVQNRGALGE